MLSTKRIQLPTAPGEFEASYFKIYDQDITVAETDASANLEPVTPWPNRIRVARFGNVMESGNHNSVDNPQVIKPVQT